MPGNTWNVMTESLDLLQSAATMISDANGEAPTPCAEWTVTQVLQHAVGDQLAWSAALGVGSGPAENPFAPSGRPRRHHRGPPRAGPHRRQHRLGRGPARRRRSTDAAPAGRVARSGGRRGLRARRRRARLGHRRGPRPARAAARWAGRPAAPQARAIIEPLRQFGAYAPALAPQPDDGHAAELLRYLGRDPQWTASSPGPAAPR